MAKYRDYRLIGLELEGAWNRYINERIRTDVSVNARGDMVGEIGSPPMRLPQALIWMRENYPDVVNASCGLHVHVSLNDLDTARLTDPKFYEMFQQRFTEWGERNKIKGTFWTRLKGKNRYCKNNFVPYQQLSGNGDRYTQINFCSYRKYKTVECRMLPAFKNVETSQLAVIEFVKIVQDYLKSCPKESLYQKLSIASTDVTYVEEEIVW